MTGQTCWQGLAANCCNIENGSPKSVVRSKNRLENVQVWKLGFLLPYQVMLGNYPQLKSELKARTAVHTSLWTLVSALSSWMSSSIRLKCSAECKKVCVSNWLQGCPVNAADWKIWSCSFIENSVIQGYQIHIRPSRSYSYCIGKWNNTYTLGDELVSISASTVILHDISPSISEPRASPGTTNIICVFLRPVLV